jgi:phosphopantothenoylcysteine decarboxylase/phosphopantothenate--cysteine ligase
MRLLVTAGPTREFFDPVRFISNPSSGKMGYAIAAQAARRGWKVDLISGPVYLPPPKGIKVTRVVTAQEMFDAAVALFPRCHAAVMTAAVCDFRPATRLEHKLKKSNRARSLRLLPTPDIAAHLGRIKGERIVIGFAMEDHDEHRLAEAKLRRKRCDAIVLNGPENVGGNQATVQIFRKATGWNPPLAGSKARIAQHVVDLVERLVGRD